MKRIVLCLMFCLLFVLPCFAETYEFEYDPDDDTTYLTQDELQQIEDSTPDDVLEFLYDAGVDVSDPFSLFNLTAKGALGAAVAFLKDRITSPIKVFAAILAAIILCALFENMQDSRGDNGMKNTLSMVGVLAVAATVIAPITTLMQNTAGAIVASGAFMTALIPIFAGILIACARAGTATGLNTVLFFVSQFVSQSGEGIVMPMCSVFFSLSITSGISGEGRLSGFLTTLKKTIVWLLGGMTFLFVAILSLQTVIGSVGDTAVNKTAKFLIGSFVPIIGSSISEALGAIVTSVGILKTGVGIYAVVVLLCIAVPLILEISLWKLCLSLSGGVAQLFGLESIRSLLVSITETMTVLMSLLICSSVLFIITITIVNMAGASV